MKFYIEVSLVKNQLSLYAITEIFKDGDYLKTMKEINGQSKDIMIHSVFRKAIVEIAKRGATLIDVTTNFRPFYLDLTQPHRVLAVATFKELKKLGIRLGRVEWVSKILAKNI